MADSNSCEFKWRDGAKARWKRRSDGWVEYRCDDTLKLTLSPENARMVARVILGESLPHEGIPRIGEIVGWRCWRLGYKKSLRLWSLFQDHLWVPGDVQEGHVGLDVGGFYAFRTHSDALSEASNWKVEDPIGVGSVSLWGEGVEATKGWRMQYCKIRSLNELVLSDACEAAVERDRQKTWKKEHPLFPRFWLGAPTLEPWDWTETLKNLQARYGVEAVAEKPQA
jgi:hypothetical protein